MKFYYLKDKLDFSKKNQTLLLKRPYEAKLYN